MYSAFSVWGYCKYRRAGWWKEDRWVASDHPQGVLPQSWGGTEPNLTFTCMMLKAKANDMRTTGSLP
ncbi:hypothetical protein TNCV_1287101 [Trichonephila clavipes]|nr:hypothetical protein TNCV_1287101 [Trichonephila clavipes]